MKVKRGAVSFYVVAFSTLILVIIAASFTTIILSELARSANDDLAQSAYDAALAGIEDAKVAFANYQECKNSGSGGSKCIDIINLVEKNNEDCLAVGRNLERVNDEDTEVFIKETTVGENVMQQAYTCVIMQTELQDYRSSLTESDTVRAVRVRLADGVKAKSVKKVRVSWEATNNNEIKTYSYPNINKNKKVSFARLKGGRDGDIAIPPIISVGIVQTSSDGFNLEDFEKVESGETNRGTVFLVPTDKTGVAEKGHGNVADEKDEAGNYYGAYNGSKNIIYSEQMAKTNNRAVKNLPFVVYCENGECSVEIELPNPIGGDRSDETFMVVVSLPYGQPNTNFTLEFYCGDGVYCGNMENPGGGGATSNLATLSGMQVKIDSTGRANNLYRRIEARLESGDTFFPFPLYAIELLGDDEEDNLLRKPDVVTCEWGEWNGFGKICPKV